VILFWKIRYLDRTDKQFKDRYLCLRTKTLDPVTRAAVELVAEAETTKDKRDILRYRHLFRESRLEDLPDDQHNWGQFRTVGPTEYFEDETGAEINQRDMGPILTGDPHALFLPAGTKQHDIDLMTAERKPIPLASVTLTQDEIRLLGYFVRDLLELSESAFMKDGPGTLSSTGSASQSPTGLMSSPNDSQPSLKTAATDAEIRSFVTIFRRLYMYKEPANFKKAAAVFVKALGDHPYAKWVAGAAGEYEIHLASVPNLVPFVQPQSCSFTTKRLIDVFLYTQYAHQPDESKERQFNECLRQVNGKQSLLTWMFLTEIWKCSLEIGNAGRFISNWFRRYCDHHAVSPGVLNSLQSEVAGLGAAEKDAQRSARLFREKVEELEMELWKQAGRPDGGPVQFRATARDQLRQALGGGLS
jgi:hypothetical protein